MYVEHFRLKEIPFSIAPDPSYLFMSEGHREALAHLLYGVYGDGGFVLLTGEVGTGKTTICRCLLEKIPQGTEIAFVLHPTLSAEEMLAAICDEFRIGYPAGNRSIKVFVDRINAYLLKAHSSGKKAVLIVEEAQNLSSEVLEQLRLLTNLETSRKKLLQIILLGQPELKDMLAHRQLLQVAQRITARYHLGPLSKNEVGAYVAHRLSVAGCDRQLFPPPVTARIFRLSGGIPRVINVLCDRALLGAYVEGKNAVDKNTLARAAREVLGESPARGKSRVFRLATAGILLAAFVAMLTSAYHRFNPPSAEEKLSTFSPERRIPGNTWHQEADYFPLLFLDPSGRAASRRDRLDFGSLQAETHERTVLQKEGPRQAVGPGIKGAPKGLDVRAEGNEAGPDYKEKMTKTERKGPENVIHP